MSVYREKGVLHVAIQRGGVRIHRRCDRGATLEEAKAYEVKLRRDLFMAKLGRQPPVALAAAIQEYLTHEARQKSIAKTRQHAYQLVDWVRGRDESEAHQVAADYLRFHRQRLAPDTINHRLAILRCTAKMAYRREWVAALLAVERAANRSTIANAPVARNGRISSLVRRLTEDIFIFILYFDPSCHLARRV